MKDLELGIFVSASREENSFSPDGPDIPDTISMLGWRDVIINESNQPLVGLNVLAREFPISISPQYFLQGISSAQNAMFLRKEAATRLVLAASFLPKGFSLVVFDAHRPLAVQTDLFNRFKDQLKHDNPDRSDDEISELAQVYVSLPSSDPRKPSPHSTGGAIDLSIMDDKGQLLQMGTEWDSFEIESQTTFFRSTNILFHKNRQMLYRAMVNAGFTNYPEEWWHYDYGNQFWGHISGKTAIYGFTEGGDN